jgi:hypothetical protein
MLPEMAPFNREESDLEKRYKAGCCYHSGPLGQGLTIQIELIVKTTIR